MQALIQEWNSPFPSLRIAFRLLTGKNERFTIHDITARDFIEDFILSVDQDISDIRDPIVKLCKQYMRDSSPNVVLQIARMIISELYRIGAIGVKLSAAERYVYSYRDSPIIGQESIDGETKIHIHPMLHRALNVVIK